MGVLALALAGMRMLYVYIGTVYINLLPLYEQHIAYPYRDWRLIYLSLYLLQELGVRLGMSIKLIFVMIKVTV